MKTLGNGGFVLDKPHEIEAFHLLAMRGRLKLESLGMKGRGPSALSQVKPYLLPAKPKTAAEALPLYEEYLRGRGILK